MMHHIRFCTHKALVITLVCLLSLYHITSVLDSNQPFQIHEAKNSKYETIQILESKRNTNPDVEKASFLELFEGRGDEKLSQDDPMLIKYVRQHYLFPPSNELLHLKNPNVREPAYESESDTFLELLELAGGKKTGGFFIEAGAWDGEWRSNTLMFERYLNWTGLLVEANQNKFAHMKSKHRNAWISNAGLSINPYPEKITITQKMLLGTGSEKGFTVQTVPLWTLLLAIEKTEIDFLCLDVELLTQSVLRTLPLDKVNIKVMMVEIVDEPDKGEAIKTYLEDNGFTFHKYHHTMAYKDNRINDIIMYKNKTY